MYIDPSNVIRLLILTYGYEERERNPTVQEKELHHAIKKMIDQCVQDVTFEFHSTYGLEFQNEHRPIDAQTVTEHEYIYLEDVEHDRQEEYEASCSADRKGGLIDEEYKRKAVEYWKSGKKQRLSLTSVRSRFKKVTSRPQLYKWEKYLQKGGTRHEKLRRISEYVLNKLLASIDENLIIHDINLRMWALEANEEVELEHFKASSGWILNFKRAHGIVSRKITKFVSRSYGTDNNEVRDIASQFVQQLKPLLQNYGAENTFNADESGFNLELHSGRTLSQKGTKTVECAVQSISATAHSYTILPLISSTGQLMSPLLIVLKETGGVFGPRVKEGLFQASNVYVEPSSSGKLTSQLFHKWFTDVYLKQTGPRSLLLIDSWTGHCSASLRQYVPADKDVEIQTIPKKQRVLFNRWMCYIS